MEMIDVVVVDVVVVDVVVEDWWTLKLSHR
jgi:hypothetical protein